MMTTGQETNMGTGDTPAADMPAPPGQARPPIPSVNYHLWRYCNMNCTHCFATFRDIPGQQLSEAESQTLIGALAGAGFEKINFAGGEPTLCPYLDGLICGAKRLGMTTSIVTNGTAITPEWVAGMRGCLDWAALSIDSAIPGTHLASGRSIRDGPISREGYLEMAGLVRRYMRLKINTVVTALNRDEDMSDFVIRAAPERWKIMQALHVAGQNDPDPTGYAASAGQFATFVSRNGRVAHHGITVVPESNDMMRGSYIMVSPDGRFCDNVTGRYRYSDPILDVGVERALEKIDVDPETFAARGGLYDW